MWRHLIEKLILPDWWAALPTAAAFAVLARALRLITVSGAVATFAVGFIVFGLGGGKFTVPLLTFFFTSSLLSRLRRERSADRREVYPPTRGRGRQQISQVSQIGEQNQEPGTSHKPQATNHTPQATVPARGATRDWVQVVANGGVASAIVLVFRLVGHTWPVEHTRYLLMLFLAALATVNGDTWATEIGGLSGAPPRLLSNWKRAAPGVSGAITALGLAAGAAGSIVVTAAGWLVWRLSLPEFIAVAWAGFLGSFLDSILGASVQAQYRDPATGGVTERQIKVGERTVRTRGIAWINNDVVNFLASLGGVGCAWLLLRYGAYAFR